jgi:glycosyltransferase involved in cell wall biosynthesis
MKVALTIARMDRSGGGPSRSVGLLAESLTQLGADVTLVTKETPDIIEIPSGVRLSLYRNSPREVREVFREADIIHDNGIWGLANYRVARLAGTFQKKIVVSPRGMLEPWAMAYHKYRKIIAWHVYQEALLRSCAGMVVTADSERQGVQAIFPGKRCVIAPNGVDLGKFAFDPERERRKQFLFLSRLHPVKGIENLLTAWAKSPTSGWDLIIAGDGDPNYVESLKRKAQGLKGVQFVGPVYGDEKVALFHESRFFVLPTFTENFGVAILEALASGCPTITTTGAPWQRIQEFQCGWWIEPTSDALITALSEAVLCDDVSQLSRNARALAETGFSREAAAKAIIAFYEEMLTSPI